MKTKIAYSFLTITLLIFSTYTLSNEPSASAEKQYPDTILIKIENDKYVEAPAPKAAVGATCSIQTATCAGCAASCKVGESAYCSPGTVWCGAASCTCVKQPSCTCKKSK